MERMAGSNFTLCALEEAPEEVYSSRIVTGMVTSVCPFTAAKGARTDSGSAPFGLSKPNSTNNNSAMSPYLH